MIVRPAALLQDMARMDPDAWRLLEELLHLGPDWVAATDRSGVFPSSLWRTDVACFYNRLNLPVEYGGTPLTGSAVRRAALFERIGAFCPGVLIGLPGPGLSMPPVLFLGTDAQKHAYFGRFTSADRPIWGAFAITEPQGGSDATAMRTTARPVADGYVISGTKCFITNGGRADSFVVFATLGRDKGRFGIRAFMVNAGTPGLSVDRREDMLGLRASQLTSISFNECHVPKEHMLGHTGKRGPLVDAFTGAQGAWDYMRPALAACINGACTGILDHADALIGDADGGLARAQRAQASDEIERLRAELLSSRLLALRAAWIYDNGRPAALHASMAKAAASTLAMRIAMSLNRLFPLAALRRGDPIEKFYRDAKAFDILEGTGDMQRLMIARAFPGAAFGRP